MPVFDGTAADLRDMKDRRRSFLGVWADARFSCLNMYVTPLITSAST